MRGGVLACKHCHVFFCEWCVCVCINQVVDALNPFPDPGISIRAASAQSMRGGAIKIPPETAPGGFLVPRDRQSEESRAISGHFYRNGTFPHRSAASLRRPTGAADATLSRRTMPPVSSLLLSH